MSRVAMLNRVLRRRGVTLVPDWQLPGLPLVTHLRRIIQVYRITCVVDVGANLGQFRDMLYHDVGWEGPVVSFEPVARCFEELISVKRAGWRCFNYALGNETAKREITVFDSPGLASLRSPDIPAMNALLPAGDTKIISRETVQIRRLSEVFGEVTSGLDASRVLLKIDTQGYDLEVFRGARDVLPHVFALQTEISFLPIYEGMPDFSASIAEIRCAGFEVSGIFPVTLDERLRLVESDCILVRR